MRTPDGVLIGRKQFSTSRSSARRGFLAQIQSDARSGRTSTSRTRGPAHGTTINTSATLRPTDHLELALLANQQWLNVDDAVGVVAPALHGAGVAG